MRTSENLPSTHFVNKIEGVDLPPALAEEGPVERDQGILLSTDSTAGR
jgi:hypothetical protein